MSDGIVGSILIKNDISALEKTITHLMNSVSYYASNCSLGYSFIC